MRTYRVTTTSGVIDIEADDIRFEPGHVAFWQKVKLAGITYPPRLVRAIHNPAVEQIEEIRK